MPNFFPPLPAAGPDTAPLFQAVLNSATTVTLTVVDAIGTKNPLANCSSIELLTPRMYINYEYMLKIFTEVFQGFVPANAELPSLCRNAGRLAFTVYVNTSTPDVLTYLNQMLENCTLGAAAIMAASACKTTHVAMMVVLSILLATAMVLLLYCGYLALPAPTKAYCREQVSTCFLFGRARQPATITELPDDPNSERTPLIPLGDRELIEVTALKN